ncbi:putative RNA-processing protein [Candidatus Haloredivivus sp. G17]|nr:putative RNA-processing protein [Candidatus Haloredivivus sp. G17]
MDLVISNNAQDDAEIDEVEINSSTGEYRIVNGTEISVYGKTVGFIGYVQNIEIAQEAVKMLLNGREHSTVYDYLERNHLSIRR